MALRVARAKENPGCMPSNVQGCGNFLIHDWVQGDIVYNQASPELFEKMLYWCEQKLWLPAQAPNSAQICKDFYHKKTLERLQQFRTKYADWSEPRSVNGTEVRTLDQYLDNIDWDSLCNNHAWRFIHGDLHFDNTIYNPQTDQFTVIDWRTDFGGSLSGDLYYDLAKMLGGLWLSYKAIKNDEFHYTENCDSATISVPSVPDVEEYQEILKNWIIKHGLDWNKVLTLVPLIYLNMSPLHDYPFDKFLVSLSQYHFQKLYE